jgi:hypothetical protein
VTADVNASQKNHERHEFLQPAAVALICYKA